MKDLFGNEVVQKLGGGGGGRRIAEDQHKQLKKIYGVSDGNKCKNCIHFKRKKIGNVYFKCLKASVSSSEATDWRANWGACGLFVSKEDNSNT